MAWLGAFLPAYAGTGQSSFTHSRFERAKFLNDNLYAQTRKGQELRRDLVGLALYQRYGERSSYADTLKGVAAGIILSGGADQAIDRIKPLEHSKLSIPVRSLGLVLPDMVENFTNLLQDVTSQARSRGDHRSAFTILKNAATNADDPARSSVKSAIVDASTGAVIGGAAGLPLAGMLTQKERPNAFILQAFGWLPATIGTSFSIPASQGHQRVDFGLIYRVNLKRGDYRVPFSINPLDTQQFNGHVEVVKGAEYGNRVALASGRSAVNAAAMSPLFPLALESLGVSGKGVLQTAQSALTPPMETIMRQFFSVLDNTTFDKQHRKLQLETLSRRAQHTDAIPSDQLVAYSGSYVSNNAYSLMDILRSGVEWLNERGTWKDFARSIAQGDMRPFEYEIDRDILRKQQLDTKKAVLSPVAQKLQQRRSTEGLGRQTSSSHR